MEVMISRSSSIAMVAAICCLILATAFPAAVANDEVPAPAPAPAQVPSPSPTSDGTAIDQGIAYVLMLVALVLTYIIH